MSSFGIADTQPSTHRDRETAAHRGNLIAFGLGVLGLGLGVATMILETPALGLGAGLCSLAAATGALQRPSESRAPVGPVSAAHELSAPVLAPSNTPFVHGDLLSAEYFEVAVRNRVDAARRFLKPVAVVRLRLVDEDGRGAGRDETVADIVSETLRECDTACVLDDSDIALVLEDTPESGAVWVVERVRRALDERQATNVWAGVACYPAHAMNADDLLTMAEEALDRARDWPQDRIEVAYAD
jgi:hypothetical protein